MKPEDMGMHLCVLERLFINGTWLPMHWLPALFRV
jgi:hypothetical protein